MIDSHTENLNCKIGGEDASILVITDVVSEGIYEAGSVMSSPAAKVFLKNLTGCGLALEDVVFLLPSPFFPDECDGSDTRTSRYMADYREEFLDKIDSLCEEYPIQCVVTLGKWALNQTVGRATKITQCSNAFTHYDSMGDFPVLPLISPANVLSRPEKAADYEAGFRQLSTLQDYAWDVNRLQESVSEASYEWCLDLQPLLDLVEEVTADGSHFALALDTETTGLNWRGGEDNSEILCIPLTYREGEALVVPMHCDYFPSLSRRRRHRLICQLRELLGNPNVALVGHHFKFDLHMLRSDLDIDVANWKHDTMQLAFVCDDNMERKGLDECVRRYLPDYAGYADEFNARVDKSRMIDVPLEDMLRYSGGDSDATFKLAKVLVPLAKHDSRNYACYEKIQMPALRTFADMEETGISIEQDELRALGGELGVREQDAFRRILGMLDSRVLERHQGKWNLGRADFLIDIIFSPTEEGGLGCIPINFTKSTRRLAPEDRKPETGKDHLLLFENDHDVIRLIIAYKKLQKMRTTYVGMPEGEEEKIIPRLKNGGLPKKVRDIYEAAGVAPEPLSEVRDEATSRRVEIDEAGEVSLFTPTPASGFWQYFKGGDNVIHPSFHLHRVVTGRTSSSEPNAQNFPKRGELAKMYRKIFVARPGHVLIESDLSQAELRIAAWMANERNMLEIYRQGGDIHAATAAATMGIPLERFIANMQDATPLQEVANLWPGAAQYLQQFSREERGRVLVGQPPGEIREGFLQYKRFQAKAINFGFLYGMSACGGRNANEMGGFRGYARTEYNIEFTVQESYDIREKFFETYPGLLAWHGQMAEFVNQHKYVRALHGALRRLPSIMSMDSGVKSMAERQAINSPVQRLGSDLGLIGLAKFADCCPAEIARLSMFIHDANIIEAREDCAMEAAGLLRWSLENPPLEEWFDLQPPIPILADVNIGPSLGEMEEVSVELYTPEQMAEFVRGRSVA